MPSSKILESKQAEVSALAASLKNAETIVLADYRGITVGEDTELRNELRKNGVQYKIVKNTILNFVADELNLSELKECFKGPTAIAYSESDPIAPAKILKNFEKKIEAFNVKGGVMDGKVASLEDINALSKVPAREELLAKLVGGLVSPIAGLAMVLNSVADKAQEASAATISEVAVDKATQVEEAANTVAE